ncbi:MAG: hypothetical protein ACRC5A_13700, partial [Enterobacteriaceae bacterium]
PGIRQVKVTMPTTDTPLLGTEKTLPVKQFTLAASTLDKGIWIDSKEALDVGTLRSLQDIVLNSDTDVTIRKSIQNEGDDYLSGVNDDGGAISVNAGNNIRNLADLYSGKGIILTAYQNIENLGSINSGHNLRLLGTGSIHGSDTSSISAQRDFSASAASIHLSNLNINGNTNLVASRDIELKGGSDIRGDLQLRTSAFSNSGTTSVHNVLKAQVRQAIHNSGTLKGQLIDLLAGSDIINKGLIHAEQLTAKAKNISNSGNIKGTGIDINAQKNLDGNGNISAENEITLTAGNNILQGSLGAENINVSAKGSVTATRGWGATNNIGISAGNNIQTESLFATDKIALQAGKSINSRGQLSSQDMQLSAGGDISTNRLMGIGDINIDSKGAFNNRRGIHNDGKLDITAGKNITTLGDVISQKAVTLNSGEKLSVARIIAREGIELHSGHDMSVKTLRSAKDIALYSGGNIVSQGDIISRDYKLRNGRIYEVANGASADVTLNAAKDIELKGTVQGNNVSVISETDLNKVVIIANNVKQ